ncbi:non-canonical purine NTP pyrophosphatase [Patescibacteria group bacterium]|nr:non-canonical purine NTP pyrophosphatase [Patescibacteria group bacterium]MBU4017343.1 non-canonical purine NTP pyrophosphatase [Patescibacteria group bacterium]MBU4098679.1 non-canonical purine NTP pyrophosphatase [Patescibacteria group bacterium]
MKKLLIATTNKGKIKELREFLSDLPLQLLTLKDIGETSDVEEKGQTYEENSRIKALFYSKKSGLPAISDDGGLEIIALDGAPGVHSRRWLGYKATDEELIKHLSKVAKSLPDNKRDAYFRTVISLALPDGKTRSVSGEVKGVIAKKPLKNILKGYPYRSFFFLPEINKFYHENQLSKEEQKLYNHRYKAIENLKPIIIEQLRL